MKIISIKKLSITILLSILVAAPLMAKDKTVAAPEVTIQKVVINPTETTTGKVIEAATLIAQDCTMSTLQGLVALVQPMNCHTRVRRLSLSLPFRHSAEPVRQCQNDGKNCWPQEGGRSNTPHSLPRKHFYCFLFVVF